MAKHRFKIPSTLDVSYFDMEFNIKSKNGGGINRLVSAKVILFTILAALGWFYLVFQMFIEPGEYCRHGRGLIRRHIKC